MNKVKKNWLLLLTVGVVVLVVGVGLLVKFGVERAAAEEIAAKFPDRGVPRINITLNGVSLSEINAGSKDVKYEGNGLSIYDGDEALEYDGVEVKGRGNGTWAQEKKPYQIKFNKKVDLFGMGKARKWVLLANAMDATNLRTASAFYMEEMLDMEYGFGGEFVELYMNSEYVGLYYLTHVVEVGKASVDLKNPLGVLVELDNVYGGDEEYCYRSRNGETLVAKDVMNKDYRDEAMRDFLESFNELEEAIEKKIFQRVAELADVDSFAKYYLLSEFTVNPDAYWTSFYFYKDGVNDKIHAGPGWDFDLTFANRSWGNWMGESFYSPMQTMVRKGEFLPKELYDEMGVEDGYEASLAISKIMYDLMELPDFRDEVKRIYRERLLGRGEELIWRVNSEMKTIAEPARIESEKWGRGDYWVGTEAMIKWIGQRYDYFEEIYGQ